MKKLSEEDKKFLLKLSVDNRNYLTTIAYILLTVTFSMSAFIFSILSVLISLKLMVEYLPYLAIFLFTIIGIIWYILGNEWKKDFERAKKLQEQYERELKELYPKLEKYYH